MTQDISLSGLRVKCIDKFNFNRDVQISANLYLPQDDLTDKVETIEIPGYVIREEKSTDGHYYGFNFEQLDPQVRSKMKAIFEYFSKAYKYSK